MLSNGFVVTKKMLNFYKRVKSKKILDKDDKDNSDDKDDSDEKDEDLSSMTESSESSVD